MFSLKSPRMRTEPYKPVKNQEAIQLSKLPDAQPPDKDHVTPIERDDWPSPPALAAACPELRTSYISCDILSDGHNYDSTSFDFDSRSFERSYAPTLGLG